MRRPARLLAVLVACVLVGPAPAQDAAKLAALEKRAAGKAFDYEAHNELRHISSASDPKKSMGHVEAILKARPLDAYMKQVVGGADPAKANAAFLAVAEKYPEYANLAASCRAWAGDDAAALAVPGIAPKLREMLADRAKPKPGAGRPWPAKFAAPPGPKAPGPWGDPADLTAWPNTTSRANGDAWLVANHDKLKVMRPRVLVLNFANDKPRAHLDRMTRQLIAALAESSRYHGSAESGAPAFLQYEVFKFVDLRDGDRQLSNSRAIPVKDASAKTGFNFKYRALFGDEFANRYGVPDPRGEAGARFLRLDELLDGGYIHEVWFFGSGDETPGPHVGAFEVVELKPKYTEDFKRLGDAEYVQAGNGGDDDQPWTGRSCRLTFLNASRGIGCSMESLAHGLEGFAKSGAVPYYAKYFKEYADFDLDAKYGLPFADLYALESGPKPIRYTDKGGAVFTFKGQAYPVEKYAPVGGSAHFPPNARGHYDLDNGAPVKCGMIDWRTGAKGAAPKLKPFTNAAFRNYRDLAPDCMGAWLVCWRQNMPGYRNRQLDDDGKPMKNWWPFLFY